MFMKICISWKGKREIQPFLGFDRGRRGRTPAPVPVAERLVAAEVWEEVSGEESRDHGTVVAVGLVAHPLTAPTRMASQVYYKNRDVPINLGEIVTLSLFVQI